MGFGGSAYKGPSEAELATRRAEERAYNESIRQKMRAEAQADEDRRKKEEEAARQKKAKWAADKEKERLSKEKKALDAAGSADEAESRKKAITTQQGGSFSNIGIDPSSVRPQ